MGFASVCISNNLCSFADIHQALSLHISWKPWKNDSAKLVYGTEFYYAELVASQEIRLQRNETENRLKNKASKRDIEISRARLLVDDEKTRLESLEGEIPFEKYIKIDNSHLAPEVVAKMIKERFGL